MTNSAHQFDEEEFLAAKADDVQSARDPREPFVSRRRRLRNRWNVRMLKGERAQQAHEGRPGYSQPR